MLICCKKDAAYTSMLPGKFPARRPERIAAMRLVLETPGPLHPWKDLGLKVLDKFGEADPLRNILAHSRMSVLSDWGATFREVVPQKGAVELRLQEHRYDMDTMERHALHWTRFSRVVSRLAFKARERLPDLLTG